MGRLAGGGLRWPGISGAGSGSMPPPRPWWPLCATYTGYRWPTIASPWADAPRLAMVMLLRDAAVELLRRPEVTGTLREEVQILAGRLLPSDRIDSTGRVA